MEVSTGFSPLNWGNKLGSTQRMWKLQASALTLLCVSFLRSLWPDQYTNSKKTAIVSRQIKINLSCLRKGNSKKKICFQHIKIIFRVCSFTSKTEKGNEVMLIKKCSSFKPLQTHQKVTGFYLNEFYCDSYRLHHKAQWLWVNHDFTWIPDSSTWNSERVEKKHTIQGRVCQYAKEQNRKWEKLM